MRKRNPPKDYLLNHVVNRLRMQENIREYLELSSDGSTLSVNHSELFDYIKQRFRRETRGFSKESIEIIVSYQLQPFRYKIRLEQ